MLWPVMVTPLLPAQDPALTDDPTIMEEEIVVQAADRFKPEFNSLRDRLRSIAREHESVLVPAYVAKENLLDWKEVLNLVDQARRQHHRAFLELVITDPLKQLERKVRGVVLSAFLLGLFVN